jgi:hypothetical protein
VLKLAASPYPYYFDDLDIEPNGTIQVDTSAQPQHRPFPGGY